MNIAINNDPDVEYKNEVILGYTLKEAVCIVAAIAIVVSVTVGAYVLK